MKNKKTTVTESGAVQTEAAAATPRAPRTPKPVNAAAQAMIDEATNASKVAKAKIKEAKSIGKLIECVNGLSAWGIEKVNVAIQHRLNALTGESAPTSEA